MPRRAIGADRGKVLVQNGLRSIDAARGREVCHGWGCARGGYRLGQLASSLASGPMPSLSMLGA